MRYDTVVTFHNEVDKYDPDLGEHVVTDDSFTRLANVTDVGTTRAVELFGDLDIGNQIIRLTSSVTEKWSYLTFQNDAKHYVKVTTRRPLKGNTMIVGENHG